MYNQEDSFDIESYKPERGNWFIKLITVIAVGVSFTVMFLGIYLFALVLI